MSTDVLEEPVTAPLAINITGTTMTVETPAITIRLWSRHSFQASATRCLHSDPRKGRERAVMRARESTESVIETS